jgi:DNA-binding response OmpR family regulator
MKKKRILVVDDEAQMVDLVKVLLDASGYEVLTALDGQEALEIAQTKMPNLIVLDVMLPKINGYKICRLLKYDKRYKHIPIIMFTARAQDKDEETGMEAGADFYLKKPYEPQVLLDKIKEYLDKSDEDKR